jgi:hypothetical protein
MNDQSSIIIPGREIEKRGSFPSKDIPIKCVYTLADPLDCCHVLVDCLWLRAGEPNRWIDTLTSARMATSAT